ncbi:MAG: cell division protein FtsL [Gammaproteobacteria bacterium]|nr:cell division protein FtsL [Gammaproteobacteria bacterium]
MKILVGIATLLLVLVMSSAFGMIYSKHQSRKLFVELQQLHKQIDELNIEWGRLQLEQSAWSAHGRVERIARKKLNMKLPDANEIVYIQQ